jgi:predicted Fe-S protein YdhL (DUF1289 family)
VVCDSDIEERFATSRFRRCFRLSDRDRAYAKTRGSDVIRSHARDFVARRLAPAAPRNDGRQTPMRGHPVFVAQHATATCCRGCLRKWHGIETSRPLTDADQERVVRLIMNWIDGHLASAAP